MTRTPLARLLQRAYAINLDATARGVPIDEAVDSAVAARRTSRRDFLRAGAAASGAMLLAACAGVPRPRAEAGDEIVVIGAGIAGLTTAWRLRQAGLRVRLFEAQERIGGRMLSLREHFAHDQVCELGGELIDTSHVRMHALAAELGRVLDDLVAGENAPVADSWYFEGRHHDEAEILREFAPLAAAIERDLATLGEDDITYRTPANAQALDAMTLTQWFDRNGASGWMRALLDVAYTTEMGLECEEQSALNLLTFIDSSVEHFRIFGESDERFHERGGNDLVVHGLADRLDDAIETGHVLEAVRAVGDGYELSLRRGTASVAVHAREVVLAMPFTTLRQVRLDVELPAVTQRAIAELRYGTNAKLMIGFDERVWRTRHGSNGSLMCDLPLQTTWETSRSQEGRGGILTNFTGGRHGVDIGNGTPKSQADKAAAELDAAFPGIAKARGGAREARFHWPSHAWTQGSYACFTPGQWTTLRGAIGENVGRLHFAGEHCALDNQGFMEGGCESAEVTVRRILESRGLKPIADPVAQWRHRRRAVAAEA
jgi:monoamine oxidase